MVQESLHLPLGQMSRNLNISTTSIAAPLRDAGHPRAKTSNIDHFAKNGYPTIKSRSSMFILTRYSMKKHIYTLFAITVIGTQALCFAAEKDWPGIKVDVVADHPVVTTQVFKMEANGFERLAISLSNQGTEPLKIGEIKVKIPLAEPLTADLDVIYGGSCMGRTPLLRQKIGAPTKQSSSTFYQMTRLPAGKYLFAGTLSWRIFMPNFTVKDGALQIQSHGEGKQLKPGQTIQYEQIVLRRADDWLGLLNQYGSAIAAENGITQLKKADYKGWATWDYYGFSFTASDLQRHMSEIKKIDLTANLFQIDAGWSTARGDNTLVRSDLPGGMKAIADQIKAANMTPGIWIDGCRADPASEIFKKHPEYFLRDQDDKVIVTVRNKGESESKEIYFDFSHPGARAYMAECVRVIKQDWGYPYLKIDFLRYGLEDDIKLMNKEVTSFKAHDPTITGVERFRLGMKAMREAMGPDAYFLGCSAVFGPCIGFVDGMRTGGDIFPRYEAFPERCLANMGNFYLHGKVFNGDADYLTFRAAEDEDDKVAKSKNKFGGTVTVNEAKMWADFNKLCGTTRLQSDNLFTLRPDRLALVKEVFDYPAMDEWVPVDLWQHGLAKGDGFELMLARKGSDVYLGVFNWSDSPKSYNLVAFGKSDPMNLEPRHSAVLKYEGKKSFIQLHHSLTSQ
jgi:alpha-galactosidase